MSDRHLPQPPGYGVRLVDAPYQCGLCWERFEDPLALMLHEAAEDDRVYYLKGVGDHGPGGDDPVGSTESKPHRPPHGGPS